MQRKNTFTDWLVNNNLSSSTASSYAGAIKTISEELKKKRLLEGSLYHINEPVLVDALIIQYFSIPEYKGKNERGNKIYSNALRHFRNFVGHQSI